MWHLRTKVGIFWIIPCADKNNEYHFGVNDLNLGVYNKTDAAISDLANQKTGYLKWDCQLKVSAPNHVEQWSDGEPFEWLEDF